MGAGAGGEREATLSSVGERERMPGGLPAEHERPDDGGPLSEPAPHRPGTRCSRHVRRKCDGVRQRCGGDDGALRARDGAGGACAQEATRSGRPAAPPAVQAAAWAAHAGRVPTGVLSPPPQAKRDAGDRCAPTAGAPAEVGRCPASGPQTRRRCTSTTTEDRAKTRRPQVAVCAPATTRDREPLWTMDRCTWAADGDRRNPLSPQTAVRAGNVQPPRNTVDREPPCAGDPYGPRTAVGHEPLHARHDIKCGSLCLAPPARRPATPPEFRRGEP